MTDLPPTSRRRFLLLAAAAGVPLCLRSLRPWNVLVAVEEPGPAPRLAGVLRDRASAGAVGRAYLKEEGAEGCVTALVESLVSALPGGARQVLSTSGTELRRLLLTRVEQDFTEDRIVTVDGWVLAQTEARLCGLVSLV